MIPKFEETVKFISDALDEKEREEFSRLKVIKRTKLKKAQAEKEKKTSTSRKMLKKSHSEKNQSGIFAILRGNFFINS